MQPTEMAYRLGRAESTALAAHQMAMAMIIQSGGGRHGHRGQGHRLGIWVQVLGILITSLASIFGITLPDRFLHFLEALMHVIH